VGPLAAIHRAGGRDGGPERFTAIRQHGWDSTLPANAMFFPEDFPKEPQWLPRALSEHVMAQLERPDNLSRWNIPAYQLVTLILMRCGLRITDALGLPGDCIVRDANGAPYLRYYNHKMKREALVPVDEELERAIGEHRRRADPSPGHPAGPRRAAARRAGR
jgi:integrase